MEDLIRKFGNVTIDVREIACIGERVNINGYTCGFYVWLKGGAKLLITIEAGSDEEKGKYDGPTPRKLMDRTDKEKNELIILWRQCTAK